MIYIQNQMKGKVLNGFLFSFVVYASYLGIGVILQYLLTQKHLNIITNEKDQFQDPIALLLIPSFFIFVICDFFIQKQSDAEKISVPQNKLMICGLLVGANVLSTIFAIYYLKYPTVMIFKSSSLILTMLVQPISSPNFDNQLTSSRVQLIPIKKMPIKGLFLLLGITIFFFFDEQLQITENQLLGIGLLVFSLVVDGTLVIFKSKIKMAYNVGYVQLQIFINNWICLFSFLFALCTSHLFSLCSYFLTHHIFALQILGLGILLLLGQIGVQRIRKQFNKSIVYLIVNICKFATVVLSIIFFNHSVSIGQTFGLIIIISIFIYEFIKSQQPENHHSAPQIQYICLNIFPPDINGLKIKQRQIIG